MKDIDYSSLISKPVKGYPQRSVVSHSYYNTPIEKDGREFRGNSRRGGDASADVQKKVIQILIETARQNGLNDRETALVLSIAKHESGFNPDAAAGTTSAHGIGQFVNKTGQAYGLTDSNRWDIGAQALALVKHFKDNQKIVQKRGQTEDYIYKYHHDGPIGNYEGLEISKKHVMPYVDAFEKVIKAAPSDQQTELITQIKTNSDAANSKPWLHIIHTEMRNGTSEIAGWVNAKLKGMLNDDKLTGTATSTSQQQQWTFSNGVKIIIDYANNIKTWLWERSLGGTVETKFDARGSVTVTEKDKSGATLGSAVYKPVSDKQVSVTVTNKENTHNYNIDFLSTSGDQGYMIRRESSSAMPQLLGRYTENTLNFATEVLTSIDNSRSPVINVVPDPQVKKQIKGEDQAAQDVQQGYAYKTPTTSIQFTKGELKSSLFTDTQRASAATNGVRPGAFQLDPNPEPAQWLAKHAHPDPAINAAVYGSLAAGATQQTFVDPLVLDLNGDGVKLTHYKIDPVFFDIDHDGYLEQTGWTSKEDGILVVDLNNNGKIDNMSETLSEYYAGAVGINGNEGEKKYKNGFEALSTLDSNNDGIFNANDQAWQTVRVWVDSNHDGKSWDDVNRNNQIDTDESSELKTLDELGVSAIDLHTQVQGNETRNGNEVLARSTFTRTSIDDQTARQQTATREVIAARFLANPVGHTFTEQGQGLVISTQKKEDSISTHNHEALIPIVLESGFSIKGENISINTHKTSLIIIGKNIVLDPKTTENIVKEEIINGFQHITIRTEEETHYRNNENQSTQISNASYTPIKTNFVTKNTIPSLMNINSIFPTVDALIEESAKIIPLSAGQTTVFPEYRNSIAPVIAGS